MSCLVEIQDVEKNLYMVTLNHTFLIFFEKKEVHYNLTKEQVINMSIPYYKPCFGPDVPYDVFPSRVII